jgi:hypothetical protein
MLVSICLMMILIVLMLSDLERYEAYHDTETSNKVN